MTRFVCVVEGGEVKRLREVHASEGAGLPETPAALVQLLAAVLGGEGGPEAWIVVPDSGPARGAASALFLDLRGVPTRVCTVAPGDSGEAALGSVLAEVSALTASMSVEDIRERHEACSRVAGKDPGEALTAVFGAAGSPAAFWRRVQNNLATGKVRAVLLARELSPGARSMVEFLSKQASPAQFLALEVRAYQGGGTVCWVPRLTGRLPDPHAAAAPGRWDEGLFFGELEAAAGAAAAGVARRLLGWAQAHASAIKWGTVSRKGCFIPEFRIGGESHQFIGVWTDGTVQIRLEVMRRRPVFSEAARREEFTGHLNDLLGTSFGAEDRLPRVPLSTLRGDQTLQGFLAILDWAIHEVRDASETPRPLVRAEPRGEAAS
ncbi:hypothetical protein IIA16_01510 [bacterium]|nr:hypothetical protein [bacterium]